MKRVAILQSNYIPWKGYFDMIAAVDEFILYDDMQYTRRDWRNRNQIKTPQGAQWITVPVEVKGKYHQTIRETKIVGTDWTRTHWMTLGCNYRRAAHYEEIANWLEPLYLETAELGLSQINRRFLEAICAYLDIKTHISNSWDYDLIEGKTERLVNLCKQVGATEYVSGSVAREYLDCKVFEQAKISISWFDYSGYLEYPQLWGDFVHQVTILDLLFNCGSNSANYMKCLSV